MMKDLIFSIEITDREILVFHRLYFSSSFCDYELIQIPFSEIKSFFRWNKEYRFKFKDYTGRNNETKNYKLIKKNEQ